MAPSQFQKKAIALSQLETALLLFREGKDLFSVITLGGAAEEILGQFLKETGQNNALDSLTSVAVDMHRHLFGGKAGAKEFASRANRARNVVKHHDPGQPHTITLDPLEDATDMLDRAIANYWRLEHNVTSVMASFADYQRAV